LIIIMFMINVVNNNDKISKMFVENYYLN